MEKGLFNRYARRIEKIFAFLFCLFFIMQIFSPSINERTLYIEWGIMLVNPFFWQWLLPLRLTYRGMVIVLLLLFIIMLGHPTTAVKIFLNLYTAMSLMYIWQQKLWYINGFILISIFVALLQLITMSIDIELARNIGPQKISSFIWGAYATQTNTNLYDAMGLGIPRAAGLSREAGFLASLLVVIFTHRVIDIKSIKINKFTKIMYVLGYIASFSKMSLVLIPAYMIIKLRNYIDKIYANFWLTIFLVLMLFYWHSHTEFLNEAANLTFLSRFGAYDTIWYLDFMQLMLGEGDLSKIGGISAINEYYGENLYAGLGGWIVSNGLLALLSLMVILWALNINGTGVVLLMFLTINVQPDTNQNFAAYAWFLCLHYFSDSGKYNGIKS